MRRLPQKLLITALTVLLSQAPLPGTHSHAGLTAEQLAEHLVLYHSSSVDSQLPLRWHFHFFWISTDSENEFAWNAGAASDRNAARHSDQIHREMHARSVDLLPLRLSHAIAKSNRESSSQGALARRLRETYKLLNVFLI